MPGFFSFRFDRVASWLLYNNLISSLNSFNSLFFIIIKLKFIYNLEGAGGGTFDVLVGGDGC